MRQGLRRILLFILVFSAAMFAAIRDQSPPDGQGKGNGMAVAGAATSPVTTVTGDHPAYGINVSLPNATAHLDWASELDMEWIKVYDTAGDWPFKVLLRIPANWEDYDDLDAFCVEVQSYVNPHADAYEIGNEPNLDWAWSEGAGGIEPPSPYEYTQVLRTAYTCIKALQPEAIVVSSGMATVGPYDKDVDPPSYPYAWNDLRFLQAMYDHGAKDFFDALGSHPHGFAYPPEQDPAAANGLTFRRVEQQRQVMIDNGDGDKQVWATEWGWLLREEACQAEWEAQGRWWQAVDEPSQAQYIRRAFEYAERHWPWMGPMFVFNLDFSMVGWYTPCDAMRYYAIRNGDGTPRQAYETLRDMPKWPYALLTPESIWMLLDYGEVPSTYTQTAHVELVGAETLTYTVSAGASWLGVPPGVHAGSGTFTLTITTAGLVTGTIYTAPVTVTVATGLGYVHRHLTVTVLVVDEVRQVYLPLIFKSPQTSVPPTPTPTPTTPAPTPTPGGCDEMIANGSFESEGDWEIPSTGYPAAYTSADAHSGSRSMRVGIVEPGSNRVAYSSARQQDAFPANVISATLRFWLYPMSSEATVWASPSRLLVPTAPEATLSGDAQYVLILDENDRWIDTLLWQREDDRQWTFHQFDLAAYAGQIIKLHFGVYNDGWGGVTGMYVDDVSLVVCSPTSGP